MSSRSGSVSSRRRSAPGVTRSASRRRSSFTGAAHAAVLAGPDPPPADFVATSPPAFWINYALEDDAPMGAETVARETELSAARDMIGDAMLFARPPQPVCEAISMSEVAREVVDALAAVAMSAESSASAS